MLAKEITHVLSNIHDATNAADEAAPAPAAGPFEHHRVDAVSTPAAKRCAFTVA